MTISNKQPDVWIYEWGRDIATRLTFDTGFHPVWTPDGQRIAFTSKGVGGGLNSLYWQWADGTGEVQRLTESKYPERGESWHPSGKFLAFSAINRSRMCRLGARRRERFTINN
jgi:Tol biopolymer transport system component